MTCHLMTQCVCTATSLIVSHLPQIARATSMSSCLRRESPVPFCLLRFRGRFRAYCRLHSTFSSCRTSLFYIACNLEGWGLLGDFHTSGGDFHTSSHSHFSPNLPPDLQLPWGMTP